jgi:hypothetical protein
MDQCTHCTCRGDYELCIKTECSQHESWIAKQRIKKIDELMDFCIWLTGCGYDFCQHEYFIERRDKLLKD